MGMGASPGEKFERLSTAPLSSFRRRSRGAGFSDRPDVIAQGRLGAE